MLKQCWECLFGSRTEGTSNEHSYIPVNKMNQNTPTWPNKNTFFVSKKLQNEGDSIIISGVMKIDPNSLSIRFITGHDNEIDYQNIACQLDAIFNENEIQISIVKNGFSEIILKNSGISANKLLKGLNFKLFFNVRDINDNNDGGLMDIYYPPDGDNDDPSYLGQITIKHSFKDIGYVQIDGDIEFVNSLKYTGIFGFPINKEYTNGEDSNKIVFLIPRKTFMKEENYEGDTIQISGKLKINPNNLSISLVAAHNHNVDYNNIACQLNANFADNVLKTIIVKKGEEEIVGDNNSMQASTLVTGRNREFNVGFTNRKDDNINYPTVDIFNTSTFFYQRELKHYFKDIRYVVIDGDIEHVDSFQYDMAENKKF